MCFSVHSVALNVITPMCSKKDTAVEQMQEGVYNSYGNEDFKTH